MDETTRKMRSASKSLQPRIIIGKNGFTEHVINDIITELKKHEMIKIKMLPTFIGDKDKRVVVEDLANKTHSRIIDFIGFTLVLTRK